MDIKRVNQSVVEDTILGIYEGQPKFLAGKRKIDDEEYQHQKQRLDWGLVPDPYDIGSYKDEMKKVQGKR